MTKMVQAVSHGSTFALTRLEAVVSGAGSIGNIRAQLTARGVERALIVTTRSLVDTDSLLKVEAAIGPLLVGTCAAAAQHAPAETIRVIARQLKDLKADAVVSFGGGSAIDACKVAVASLLHGRDMTLETAELDLSAAFRRDGQDRDFLHIAVPTTLSAGAFTPAGGVLDREKRIKGAIVNPRIQPAVVIHDAELTLDTPDWLWLSTGMRALDHAIEAIYARRNHPVSDALAFEAIRLLVAHLKPSVAPGAARLDHRSLCLEAAWMSLFGGFNTGLGLSHALGHQIGPAWNVPHGITSCVTLPHAMRFMADMAPARFERIAAALDEPFDPADPRPAALASAERIAALVTDLDLPRSLEEVGVTRSDIGFIAEATRSELAAFDAMDRPVTVEDIMVLLEKAFPRPAKDTG